MKKIITISFFTFIFTINFLSAQVGYIITAPTGVTSTQVRAPNCLSTYAYLRACSLVLPGELTGIPVNGSITAFGFTIQGAPNITSSGNFTVYLQNTANTTYQKGTSWPTIISGMTTAYTGTMTVSASSSSVMLTLPTSFIYTGGGLYVAYDWYSSGPYASTPTTYWAEGSALSPGCASANSATSAPTTLGTTAFRPNFLFTTPNTYTNELSVLNIEAPGTLPGHLSTAQTIKTTIRNGSNQTLNNIPITLNVTGINPYTTTQTLTSLAAGATATIGFTNYLPLNAGLSTLSVSVPNDQVNINNSRVYTQNITCSEWALNPAGVTYTQNSIGFNTGSGIIAVSYTNLTASTLTGLRGAISSNASATGNAMWGVLLNSSGSVIATTNTVSIANVDLGSFVTYTFATPPQLNAGSNYYFGFAQPSNALGYYPLGTYTVNPSPYLNYITTSTLGGVLSPFASDLGYPGISAIFLPTVSIGVNAPVVLCGNQAVLSATPSVAGSYTWSGISANSNYSVTPVTNTTYTVMASYGNCAFTNTTLVTVNPINVTAGSNTPSVCVGNSVTISGNGASSYTWNTAPSINTESFVSNPVMTTTYSVLGANANGCSNTASVMVTVNANPTITANSQTVICGTQSTLSANSTSSYSWTNGPVNADFIVTPIINGSYTITSSTAYGCSTSATLNVIITPIMVNATSGSPSVCSGSSVGISASGATNYTWNTIPATNTSSLSITPSTTATYIVIGSNPNGCSNSASITITVDANPTITVNSQTVVCGAQTTLSATSSAQYTWTNGPVNADFVITPTVSTNYTVTSTTAIGCSASSTLEVVVNPLLVTAASSSSVVCSGSNLNIIGGGATSYTWNTSPAIHTSSFTANPVVSTTYNVIGENSSGCSNTASVTVAVIPGPTITANSILPEICAGSLATFTASGANTYIWSQNTTTLVATNNTLLTNPLISTIYAVEGTDLMGCKGQATVMIIVNSLPLVTVATPTTIICLGESAILEGQGATTYLWSEGSTTNTLLVTPLTTGSFNYSVTGSAANSCTASALAFLEVSNCTGIRSASAHTIISLYPNPTHGLVNLKCNIGQEKSSIKIFNLLGEVVFEIENAGESNEINLQNQLNGIYIVIIYGSKNEMSRYKLIKQ